MGAVISGLLDILLPPTPQTMNAIWTLLSENQVTLLQSLISYICIKK